MPPERSKKLVDEMRAFYANGTWRQKDLAAVLGLSPQAFNEILAGRNQPNSETALRMLEFLQTDMKPQQLADPPHARPTARSDDEPKTLLAAKEKIAELTAQLNSQSAATTGENSRSPAIKPATRPQSPRSQSRLEQLKAQSAAAPRGTGMVFNQAPPTNPSELPDWQRVQSAPAPPAKLLPASANTPYLCDQILRVTNFEDLLSMLENSAHSALQRACIFAEVQSRRAIASDPK